MLYPPGQECVECGISDPRHGLSAEIETAVKTGRIAKVWSKLTKSVLRGYQRWTDMTME